MSAGYCPQRCQLRPSKVASERGCIEVNGQFSKEPYPTRLLRLYFEEPVEKTPASSDAAYCA